MASTVWTADRRLYLTKEGTVVEADDPTRASLLVPAGGTLPLARAQELGLVVGEPTQEGTDESPSKRKPANKLRQPDATKTLVTRLDAETESEK